MPASGSVTSRGPYNVPDRRSSTANQNPSLVFDTPDNIGNGPKTARLQASLFRLDELSV
jgi:hypothetical protein